MQQRVERALATAHEDAQERQAARVCPLWGHIRSAVATNCASEGTQRGKALSLSSMLESVRALDCIEATHTAAHGGETIRLRPVQEHRVFATPAFEKAHVLHPQDEQAVRLHALQVVS